jgi:hypothetical protein
MSALTPDQIEAVNDSDAVCPCGADPRAAESLAGWFVETRLVGTRAGYDVHAVVRCPTCW